MSKNKRRDRAYRQRQKKWLQFGDWISRICPICSSEQCFFFYKYDAVCCLKCDNWLEKACNDPNCSYCANRPKSPLEALYMEEQIYAERPLNKEKNREEYQHKDSGTKKHFLKREAYKKYKGR